MLLSYKLSLIVYTPIKYGKVFIPICHVGLYHALVLTFILSPSCYFLLFFLWRIFLSVLLMR